MTLSSSPTREQRTPGPKVCASTGRRCSPARPRRSSASPRRRPRATAPMLPSDVDGATPPPDAAPRTTSSSSARTCSICWKFHVDWSTPANSTFIGPDEHPRRRFYASLRAAAPASRSRGRAVKLDSLGDRLMYRLAYRNFGDHESLVVNHSVTAGSSTGDALVRDAESGRHTDRLPAGHVRARLGVPLDGQHRDGPERRHRARLQRVQLDASSRASATPGGSPATRSAR